MNINYEKMDIINNLNIQLLKNKFPNLDVEKIYIKSPNWSFGTELRKDNSLTLIFREDILTCQNLLIRLDIDDDYDATIELLSRKVTELKKVDRPHSVGL